MNHHERMDRPQVVEPTEARQATPQRMNLRVLFGSLLIAAIVGSALVAAFWYTTPTAMDTSSGGTAPVAPGTTPDATAPGPGPTVAQPPPPSAATPAPSTTETAPASPQTSPDAVTAPPAAPGNNPGTGTATP